MKSFTARVKVMPQKEILDPQGKAVESALGHLGLAAVDNVRIGKNIEFNLQADDKAKAMEMVHSAAEKLLANPIMEFFEIELSEK